jgi:peptide/nickel transport system substrate-binding protein
VANQGGVSPSCLGYDDSLPLNVRDLAESARLLDEAGFIDADGDGFRELPDGQRLDVKMALQSGTDIYKRIAEIIQINLAEAGIRVSVDEQTVSNADYAQKLRMDGVYEIYIGMTTAGIAQWTGIASYLADVTITSGQHFGTYADEEYLNAYNGMLYAASYEEYIDNFRAIQAMNATDCPGVALAVMQTFYPYRTDRVTGWINYPAWGVVNPTTWYKAVSKI